MFHAECQVSCPCSCLCQCSTNLEKHCRSMSQQQNHVSWQHSVSSLLLTLDTLVISRCRAGEFNFQSLRRDVNVCQIATFWIRMRLWWTAGEFSCQSLRREANICQNKFTIEWNETTHINPQLKFSRWMLRNSSLRVSQSGAFPARCWEHFDNIWWQTDASRVKN